MNTSAIELLMDKADALLASGQAAEARSVYRQICDLEPGHADAHFMLGAIAAETGEAAVAERELRAALAADPDHAESHLHLGELLRQRGAIEEAIAHAKQAVHQDDDYPEAWLLLSILQAMGGDLVSAERSCNRAVRLLPDNPQARSHHANLLRSLGQLAEAVTAFKRALELQPNQLDALLGLAQVHLLQGSLDEASRLAEAAIAVEPDCAEASFIKGVAYAQQQRLNEACDCFNKSVSTRPDYIEAWMNLGNAYLNLGDLRGAEDAFRQAVRIKPELCDAFGGLAEVLNRDQRYDEALEAAEHGCRLQPDNLRCRLTLASALAGLGRDQQAQNHFLALLGQDARLLPAHVQLARLYQRRGHIDESVRHQRQAVQLAPRNPSLYCDLAGGLQLQGQFDEAMAACQRALELAPDLSEAITRQISILERQGRFADAMATLEPLLRQQEVEPKTALTFARLSPHLGRVEEGIALLEAQLATRQLRNTTQDKMHKLLAKLYDSCGDFERAFDHNTNAHALRSARFDPKAHDAEVDSIIQSVDAACLSALSGHGETSERPVFIVGMPRSGTSLVEQILASHPSVFGAGELGDIPELAASLAAATGSDSHLPTRLRTATAAQIRHHATRYLEKLAQLDPSAARVIDKLPHNFLYLGVIQALFPRARVIHIRRNALDTCISCHLQDFSSGHAYAYNLEHLGHYYRAYERIMDHWRHCLNLPILEMDYEDLISDQVRVSRMLIEFCGLPWDDRCLRFHETHRTVTTPSYDQVRRPLYDSSVERWRNYEPWLGPLREALRPKSGIPKAHTSYHERNN